MADYKALKKCHKEWIQERNEVIVKLKTFQDEIQVLAKNYAIGKTAYAGVGLVGGGIAVAGLVLAPWFFGPAAIAAAVGAGAGVVGGAADITHGKIKYDKVKTLCKNSENELKKHDEKGKELEKVIEKIKKLIIDTKERMKETGYVLTKAKGAVKMAGTGLKAAGMVKNGKAAAVFHATHDAAEATKALKIGKYMNKVIPGAAKEVAYGVTKLSKGALRTLTAVGIVIDVGTIIFSVRDLSNFSDGELCEEAKRIKEVIDDLENGKVTIQTEIEKIEKELEKEGMM